MRLGVRVCLIRLCYAMIIMRVGRACASARGSLQMKRLEAASRTPVFQIFGESLRGLVSIRAFRAQSRLLASFAGALNHSASTFVYYDVRCTAEECRARVL